MKKTLISLAMLASTMGVMASTVIVDNSNKVKLSTEEGEVAVIDGSQTVSAGTYMVSPKQADYKLCNVRVNGDLVQPMAGTVNYMIELGEYDSMSITADYGMSNYPLTIDVENVESVTVNGVDMTALLEEIPAGYLTTVVAKDCGKATVNGEEVAVSNNTFSFYMTGYMTVVMEAATAETYATVIVDNSNKVKFSSENGEIALINGNNSVSAGQYMIQPAQDGYKLCNVRKNGDLIQPMAGTVNYMVELGQYDNMSITADYGMSNYPLTIDTTNVVDVTVNGVSMLANLEEMPAGYLTTVVAKDCGKATVNGEEVAVSDNTFSFYMTGYMTVVMEAATAETYATVIVDNSNKVKFSSENGEIALINGNNSVSAGQYMIQPAQAGYKLCNVRKNGDLIQPMAGTVNYMVEIGQYDNVSITADYGMANYPLTIDLDNVESITVNGVDMTAMTEEMPAGYLTTVVAKDCVKATVNGEEVEVSNNCFSFYMTGYMTVVMEAAPRYATVIVDNSNKVKFSSEEGEIALINGSNSISAGQYMIQPAQEGYKLCNVRVNGDLIQPMAGTVNYMVELGEYDNMSITADYGMSNYPLTIDTENVEDILVNGVSMLGNLEEMPAGYLTTVIAKDCVKATVNGEEVEVSNNTFSFYMTGFMTVVMEAAPRYATVIVDNSNKVKLISENGEIALINGSNSVSAGKYTIEPAQEGYMLCNVRVNGDLIQPTEGLVYEVELGQYDNLSITADYGMSNYPLTIDVENVEDILVNGVSMLNNLEEMPAGYLVTVIAKDCVAATVNGQNVEVSDNTFSFYMTGYMTVTMQTGSVTAIRTITNGAAETTIYNVQGIKVDTIGEGMFIINGKKAMIRK